MIFHFVRFCGFSISFRQEYRDGDKHQPAWFDHPQDFPDCPQHKLQPGVVDDLGGEQRIESVIRERQADARIRLYQIPAQGFARQPLAGEFQRGGGAIQPGDMDSAPGKVDQESSVSAAQIKNFLAAMFIQQFRKRCGDWRYFGKTCPSRR